MSRKWVHLFTKGKPSSTRAFNFSRIFSTELPWEKKIILSGGLYSNYNLRCQNIFSFCSYNLSFSWWKWITATVKKIRETANFMPFTISDGMICGPHRGSFPVGDHLRCCWILGTKAQEKSYRKYLKKRFEDKTLLYNVLPTRDTLNYFDRKSLLNRQIWDRKASKMLNNAA